MTDVQHTQPWLNHYPEGIDWSCELTRQPLNDYMMGCVPKSYENKLDCTHAWRV